MLFRFFSNPSPAQTSLFILLFPFFSLPRILLLSSSFPRSPPSQHARGGFIRHKAIYDHQPMATFNPFTSCTQMRAWEIRWDKQKQRDWRRGSLWVIFTLSVDWVQAPLLCVNSGDGGNTNDSPCFRDTVISGNLQKSEVFNLTECLFYRNNCLTQL